MVYVKIYLAARWRARRHLKGAGGRRRGCVEMQPTTSQRPLAAVVKVTSAGASRDEPVPPSSLEAGFMNDVRDGSHMLRLHYFDVL